MLAAQRLRSAVLHPDTQQPIPLPFRMAAHVPVNTALLLGMLLTRSPLGTGAWQFVNATYNALQFYANRNASNHVTDGQLLASYIGATTSSVGVGVALRYAISTPRNAFLIGWRLRIAQIAVPFVAAVSGKPLQIGLMRSDELTSGVAVFDEDGTNRGLSRIAGASAVCMTLAVRTVYLAPMLYLPFLQEALLSQFKTMQSRPLLRAFSFTLMTALSSAIVTPICMALFDQWASLPVYMFEDDIRERCLESSGEPVRRLYFNKGL